MGSVAASLSAVLALVVAVVHPGVDVAEVELHDGGVWVTNSSLRLVGHLNYPARQLDSALRAGSGVFDVFQSGDDVAVYDGEASSVARVDVSRVVLERGVPFSGLSVEVGGGTVGVVDGAKGRVWFLHDTEMESFDANAKTPDFEGMPGGVMTIGADGALHVVSAEAQKGVSLRRVGGEIQATSWPLDNMPADADVQISAVGAEPVVLERESGRLHLAGGSVISVEGKGLSLQESGPAADAVLVATDTDLLEVPLAGGEVKRAPTPGKAGVASRPVRVGSCMYGGWSVSGAFVRDCEGATPVSMLVESLSRAEQAVFRVNRDVVVLNDVKTGGLWLADEEMLFIDNWEQVESEVKSEEESEDDSTKESDERALPQRSEHNTPPVAVNDELGVRAGRRNILPVLLNDSDADGDVLTVRAVTEPSWGSAGIARDGAALWIDVPEGVAGTSSFEYEVADGRGGFASARVTVSVRALEINEAPRQTVVPTASVGVGRHTTVHTLGDWYDPDGDPFYLEGATGPAGLTVRTHVNGAVELTEAGHGPGKTDVELRVSDGRDMARGSLTVTIRDGANEPPIANADHIRVARGAQVSLSPLKNDTDPNGDALHLVQIDSQATGVSVTTDPPAGLVFVQGQEPGSYYVNYTVSDSAATTVGVIRVDVIEPDVAAPLSVEPDLGILPEGGHVLVDVLANDSDPSGGVLTVQSVDVPAGSPLVVAVIDHQLVRVAAPGGLNGPAEFSYTVSNGRSQASSTVKILPHIGEINQGPEAADDNLVVRVGDVAGVAVLDNDRSPLGLRLELAEQIQHEIPADVASVFVSNNVIRVRGGARPGSGRITYTVIDAAGNVASAGVNVTVVGMDEASNRPPHPRDLLARTVAGQPVDIVVPLDNIDPEGDSVSLVGPASAPQLGGVEVRGSVLRYTPTVSAAGTDSFTYEVEDRLGARAVGTVRVGVAPTAGVNHNPVAVPDQVLIRPGARVAVSVLANDIDSDGDPLVLAEDSVKAVNQQMQVSQRGKKVIVQAPNEEGTYGVSYGVSDTAGGYGAGLLTVIIDSQAPLLAPIARDDEISVEDVQQAIRESRTQISVNVVANDEDPDGDIDSVKLSSPDSQVKIEEPQRVTVTLTPEAQVLIYTITDTDNKASSAVIRVPGFTVDRPTLDLSTVPVRIQAGQNREIAINDHIITGDGQGVSIVDPATISVSQGSDGLPVVKDPQTITFRALPDFSGPASMTFTVVPNQSAPTTEGTVITLPVEIAGATNRAPILRPTGVILAAGQPSQNIDMTRMVSDPDGEDPATMTYTLTGQVPTGINASISGSTLTLSATEGATPGTLTPLELSVTDSQGATAQGVMPLTVSATPATVLPPIQISPASVTISPGEQTRIDLAAYATHPAPERGPLTMVGTPVSARENLTLQSEGTRLTISARGTFTGTTTIAYTLTDTPDDPSRHARGTITVNVLGAPKAPTNLSARAQGPRTAEISWTPGETNGAPITYYTVTDHTQGDTTTCPPSTRCLIPRRDPATEHTFTVTATNAAGQSEPSAPVTLTFAQVPETPSAPQLSAGDAEVSATIQPVLTQGSPILDYEVTLQPGGATQTVPASTSVMRVVFKQLTNGTQYTATVRARNAHGHSHTSASSAPVTPFGQPGPVRGLQAHVAGDAGTPGSARLMISWQPPANVSPQQAITYWVSVADVVEGRDPRETLAPRPLSTDLTSMSFDLARPQDSVVVNVWAMNSPVEGDIYGSPREYVIVDVAAPPLAAPRSPGLSVLGRDNKISVYPSILDENNHGFNGGKHRFEWNSGGGWHPLPDDKIIGPFTNGDIISVSLRVVVEANGAVYTSPASEETRLQVHNHLNHPDVSCQKDETVRGRALCSWNIVSSNENLRTMAYIETIGHGDHQEVEPKGSKEISVDPDKNSKFCFWAQLWRDDMQLRSAELPDWVCVTIEPWPAVENPEKEEHVAVAWDGLNATITVTNYKNPGLKTVSCIGKMPPGRPQVNLRMGSAELDIPENGHIQLECGDGPAMVTELDYVTIDGARYRPE